MTIKVAFNHAGDYFFDGAGFDFFVDAFFSQEVFKAGSNTVIFHVKPFSRLSGKNPGVASHLWR